MKLKNEEKVQRRETKHIYGQNEKTKQKRREIQTRKKDKPEQNWTKEDGKD